MGGQNDSIQLDCHNQTVIGNGQGNPMKRRKVGHKGVYVGQNVDKVANDQKKEAKLKDLHESLDQYQPAAFLLQKSCQDGFLLI